MISVATSPMKKNMEVSEVMGVPSQEIIHFLSMFHVTETIQLLGVAP